MSRKPKAAEGQTRKRSFEAVDAWRRGHGVHKSAKTYSRKAKHKKPRRDHDDLGGFFVSAGLFEFEGVATRRAHPARLG